MSEFRYLDLIMASKSKRKPSKPKMSESAFVQAKHDFKIHIAIDFGTDGTALAYAFPQTGKEDKIFVHKDWTSTKYNVSVKPKTTILFDENGEMVGFGKDAKHNYMTAMNKSDVWMLFERFKMSLYNDEENTRDDDTDEKQTDHCNVYNTKGSKSVHKKKKISIKETLTATNGKTMSSAAVFTAALKFLKKLATNYLKRKRIRGIRDSDIQWIITVPAIWNDKAKWQMRQWALDAGLGDGDNHEQCKIVYEPDCASLALQHYIHKTKSYRNNFEDSCSDSSQASNGNNANADTFIKGDKYVLVDAGGGTVDIACHEILGSEGEFGVKEILHPSGGPWGSAYIDDQFIQLLKDMFSNEWIDEFQARKPQFYTELIHDFQASKHTFFVKRDKKTYNVKLPFEFIGFIQDKLELEDGSNDGNGDEIDIEDFVAASTVFGQRKGVLLNDEYLCINAEIWKHMFDFVVIPALKHIERLLGDPKMARNCKYLCLVGGLSMSPYYQYVMGHAFGPESKYALSVIIPPRPILSVVEGAAYFGVTKNYIKARILQHTYGQVQAFYEGAAAEHGVPKEYIANNKYFDAFRRQYLVRCCLQVIAGKNEEIYTGQIKKVKAWRPSVYEKTIAVIIICSALEDPKVEADGTLLGEISVTFDNENADDMEIITEFHFYETLIKAVVYRPKTPDQKEIRYII